MLTKIGDALLNEKRIDKFKNISDYLLLAGIFLFISLPLLSDRIFITEKQMKHTDSFYSHLHFENFVVDVKEFFSNIENPNPKLEMIRQLRFSGENKGVFTYEINSQRGERNKFLMINTIYEGKGINLFPIYGLIKFFSRSENFRWLTKDIQFNFIDKNLFYNQSKELVEYLTSEHNSKIREGQLLDFVLNIDMTTVDFEYMNKILIQITGANSEIVDMDFYKVIFDNLLTFYPENEITTVDYFFNPRIKFYLKNIFYNIGSLIEGFFPKSQSNEVQYSKDFIYFLENILANYLNAGEKLNTNHLIISKGINSILFRGRNKRSETDYQYSLQEGDLNKYYDDKFYTSTIFRKYHSLAVVFEKALKVCSISEIEIFRGDYNYIMTNSHSFVGVGIFIFVPVLCILRIFYEILFKIYKNDIKVYKSEGPHDSITASKVISFFLFSFLIEMLLILHIGQIKTSINFSYHSTYLHILAINFIISFLLFRFMRMNKFEEVFADTVIRFMIAVNCFNFFFIVYGFGLLMTVVLLPLELLLVYFNEKINKTFLQIFSIFFVLYCMLMDRSILEVIISNYVNHFNNVYPLFSIVVILLTWRVNLIIRRWLNMEDRITSKTREEREY